MLNITNSHTFQAVTQTHLASHPICRFPGLDPDWQNQALCEWSSGMCVFQSTQGILRALKLESPPRNSHRQIRGH